MRNYNAAAQRLNFVENSLNLEAQHTEDGTTRRYMERERLRKSQERQAASQVAIWEQHMNARGITVPVRTGGPVHNAPALTAGGLGWNGEA